MRKVFAFVFIFFFLAWAFLAPVSASRNWAKAKSVVLPKDEVVDGDYFASGGSLVLSGRVNGDTYLAGGNIIFDGQVKGDILAAGGNVNILGDVDGDVRVAAGNVVISGEVKGSVSALSGSVSVIEGGKIGKNFVPVAGQIVLTSGAGVGGDLTYWSEQEVQVQEGATVSGEIKRNQPSLPDRKYALPGLAAILAGVTGAIAAFKIIGFLSALLLGLLFIKFFPVYTQDTADVVKKKPWASLGVGFVSLIAVPLLVIILFATVIGWVLALITVFAYLVIWFLAQIFVALFLGQRLFATFSKKRGAYWGLFLGLLVFALLDFIPFVGWVVGFALTLMGIGAVLIEGKTLYTSLRVKKII